MAEKLQIAIVGLGPIGASAGLALRQYVERVSIVGHDKDSKLAARAKKMNAVDRTEWNLINAVSEADRILLALPLDEIKKTLTAISQDLKPGCILVDTAEIKAPVMALAADLRPKGIHLIGGHPILVLENPGIEGARADLFQDKLFCLTPDAQADAGAVRLAADLVEALGAKPFFLDAAEHDSMIAAAEHVPEILAGALSKLVGNSSGWHDMRKVAASQFYSSTLLMADNGSAAATACNANREHALHWLDQLIAELRDWRQNLADGNVEALAQAFDQGLEARQGWLRAFSTGNWEEIITPEFPTSGTLMRGLIGFPGPRGGARAGGPPRPPVEKKKP